MERHAQPLGVVDKASAERIELVAMSITPPPSESIGAEVRGLLAKHKISQSAAGQHLGLSHAALSRRLLGEVPFNVDELVAIAALLGVPTQQLLGAVA